MRYYAVFTATDCPTEPRAVCDDGRDSTALSNLGSPSNVSSRPDTFDTPESAVLAAVEYATGFRRKNLDIRDVVLSAKAVKAPDPLEVARTHEEFLGAIKDLPPGTIIRRVGALRLEVDGRHYLIP